MTFKGLIKMKCCVVLSASAITAYLFLTHNPINAGVSGTVALIYGIGLCMLIGIGCYDRCINKDCIPVEEPIKPLR